MAGARGSWDHPIFTLGNFSDLSVSSSGDGRDLCIALTLVIIAGSELFLDTMFTLGERAPSATGKCGQSCRNLAG